MSRYLQGRGVMSEQWRCMYDVAVSFELLQLPELDHHVVARRPHHHVLRVELHRRHEVLVPLHPLFFLPEVQVPNADGLVVRGRVEVAPAAVEAQAAHPVVVAVEGVQVLAGLAQEQLDQLVPAAGEDEGLVVVGHPVGALLVQLLQRVHPHLGSELVLQELGVHQLGCCLSLHQQHRLYHVVVGEEPQRRRLLTQAPHANALVVRPADEGLPVLRHRQPPHPGLVASVGALAVPAGDLPEFDCLVARAAEDEVVVGVEGDVADVVVVAEEGLEALVVVVEVPQLDAQVGGAAGQVAALGVVADVVDGVCVAGGVLVWPRRVLSRSPVSNSHTLMVPSSELVASWVYWGWKASAVMFPLCPFISRFGGVLGMNRSQLLGVDGPGLPGTRSSSYFKFLTCSSRLVIFFWRERMDFHLSSSLLPSGSTSASDPPAYYAIISAVRGQSFLTRYSRMSLLSWFF